MSHRIRNAKQARLLLRSVSDFFAQRLKERAAIAERTMEEDHRQIVEAALAEPTREQRQAQAAAIRLNRLLKLLNEGCHGRITVPMMAELIGMNTAGDPEDYFRARSEAPFADGPLASAGRNSATAYRPDRRPHCRRQTATLFAMTGDEAKRFAYLVEIDIALQAVVSDAPGRLARKPPVFGNTTPLDQMASEERGMARVHRFLARTAMLR